MTNAELQPITIPDEIIRLMTEFMGRAKTGKLELDIVEGKIAGYRITEAGRIKAH